MPEFQQQHNRFINGLLSDRERMYYAAQGRLYEGLFVAQGSPALPSDLQNEDGYIALALGLEAVEMSSEGDRHD
ncbi:hypothetical protein IQ268_09245 [Oculatella sp. LEGE 06141]|uniref:hypothetical protein n=1 Tax=Oculatella sp. LEGE 06141 TaxID=1828648 RepID=UPI00187EDB9B|nr:hypothetical protein [Oculatella sp. LEGE 06141]MBE9178744.1 hypothetical protein [Oculatella sp. LEGE 06141]